MLKFLSLETDLIMTHYPPCRSIDISYGHHRSVAGSTNILGADNVESMYI